VEGAERVGEAERRGAVDGVARRGAVDGDDADFALAFDDDGTGRAHGRLLRSWPATREKLPARGGQSRTGRVFHAAAGRGDWLQRARAYRTAPETRLAGSEHRHQWRRPGLHLRPHRPWP